MEKQKEKKENYICKWGVRALAVSASTLAAVALIKGEFQAGGFLALGWLLIVIAEKRICKTLFSETNTSS